jgi:hypothetical protein
MSGYRPMTPEQRHARHHEHLAAMQDKIDRVWARQYANAKERKTRAPRKFATHATRSQRVSQVAAWRSHLQGMHGVPVYGPGSLGPFVSLADLQAMHGALHEQEES